MGQITEIPNLALIPEAIAKEFNEHPTSPAPQSLAERFRGKVATLVERAVNKFSGYSPNNESETNPLDTYSRQILNNAKRRTGHPELLALSIGYVVERGTETGVMLQGLSSNNDLRIKQQFRELNGIWAHDKSLTDSERAMLGNFRDAMILGLVSPKKED